MTITSSTRFIHVASGSYPETHASIKANTERHPDMSHPSGVFSLEYVTELGYAVVEPVAMPEGDVVEEGAPVKDGSVYRQSYLVRAFTPEEIQERKNNAMVDAVANLHTQIKVLAAEAIAKGVPFNFGEPYGIQHIQVRDGDRANMLALRTEAEAVIAGLVPPELSGFRTYEDKFIPLAPNQVVSIGWQAFAGYRSILMQLWGFQDAIDSAETIEELPELPEAITVALKEVPAAIPVGE